MSSYEVILAQFQEAQRRHAQGDLAGTLALYDAILREKPDLDEVHANRGVVLRDMRRLADAIASFDQAIAINPGQFAAFSNKGHVLTEQGELAQALAVLDQAIALRPDFPDAHNNRGVALRRLNRLTEALQSYDRAIALDPQYGEAWSNRGEAYAALQQFDPAIGNFERALAFLPNHADTLLNYALALQKRGRFRDAAQWLKRAGQVDPSHKKLLFGLAYGALQSCDWAAQEALRPRLMAECPAGKSIVPPLALLQYLDDPETLRRSSAHYLKDLLPPAAFAAQRPALTPHDKIRIAYISGDFHEHATAYLTVDLFERHDRSQFEIHAVSFGPQDQSAMQARLRRAFDQFHDVQSRGDAEVADLLRRLEVDIAVDLKGFTAGERPGIFTRKAVPVQVNYLGYPGTMAAGDWDYIIADKTVLPRVEKPFYAEQIVHLDCCYQATDPARHIDTPPSRASQGLPPPGTVFCCFNNHAKITRPLFDVWMRLLRAVPDGVLWLLEGSATAVLQSEARARGIDPARLVFAPFAAQGAHLARLSLADLVLDTLPYNAHTTASDALWAGVPVVTCRGRSFAGRVAASLLEAAGLPELITEDLAAYEALALNLARDDAQLGQIKSRLRANRHSAPLFENNTFRRNLEQAYRLMIEKARRGEAPAGFDVTL